LTDKCWQGLLHFPIYQMEGQFGLYLKNYKNQKKKDEEEEEEEKKRKETLIDKYLLV